MASRPLVVELFCGRFGWSRGFTAEGFQAVGFDIVHEDYHGEIPEGCELVLQDVLTLHGSQFRDAAAIVASPPCQRYSYMAMPWDRAKTEAKWQRWFRDSGSPFADRFALNDLFDACFRIQREASAAAGHYIPMVVENVKGAQPWVGRAAWHYGSYYLWGDVPALMPFSGKRAKIGGAVGDDWFVHHNRQEFFDRATKNNGGSWFAEAHNAESGHSQNPVNGVKVSGLNWSNHGKPGFKAQGFNVTAAQRYREEQGVKNRDADGYERTHPEAFGWKAPRTSSRSDSRKAASAAIAEITYDLSNWVARCLKP